MKGERNFHQVLLVEDNPGDIGLIRRALARSELQTQLHVAHDGPEALAYLARCRLREAGGWRVQEAGFPARPDLILLDLSLPKMDGCEVLARIRCDPLLGTIPVVILSSSHAEQDVVRSYEHAANCFITKPLDLDRYMAVIGSVQRFWLTSAKTPRDPTHE